MKKMYLVLAAVLLAVSFSAFTEIKKAPAGDFKYDDGSGMVDVPSTVDVNTLCPAGNQHDCVIEINGEDELIYLNGNVYRWQ
ncbi:MAG: hypothetical protein J0M10_03805 [Chitinophagales bacterium]|nr:hypothetical protein [Chitinophagales bacterium]